VPVPVQDGVDQEPTLDDLYVTYWVSQHDVGACTALRCHLRHTFTMVPNINLTLENKYTVFLECPQESAVQNNVLVRMTSMSVDHDAVGVKGSVLIVKQAVCGASMIMNITKDNILLINFLLNR
jgi:2-methylaconitate cis-trans-isomerase PrpF